MALHKDRIDRIDQLEALIPRRNRAEDCPHPAQLLERLNNYYAHHTSPAARRRAIQRDLEELVADGRIEPVNPGGKPLRYRRCSERPASDPYLWDYARKSIKNILQAELPAGQLEAIWQRMLEADSGTGLDTSKLRIVSDSQRLRPAPIRDGALANVLEALALSRTLVIGYRDAADKVTRPVIHPQALLQRGPRVYLFALKGDETQVRMYALHRITACKVDVAPARQAEGFDLEREIQRGNADFGNGNSVHLVMRARGYVASLLRECSLSTDQCIEDEEADSDFELRVSATIPETGQLLRWLLGCGDKIEVLAPETLRAVVAAQTAKAARLYAPLPPV